MVVYLSDGKDLAKPLLTRPERSELVNDNERAVATWVLRNNKRAGATTDTLSSARCLYYAIRVDRCVYGVVGIAIDKTPLESFETSILISLLGECALALENIRNAREKEEAAVLARNEQMRANLLRAISHDLRTPLTSISGNADTLLNCWKKLDDDTRVKMFTDIYDDSQWLINLVDNAIKYTPAGSHITIRLERAGKWVKASVADDGPGIPDEQKPHVFDMFYCGSNKVADSRRNLGLGLSLCKSIINAHGGKISVADNPPQGTVFTFTVPAGEVTIHE